MAELLGVDSAARVTAVWDAVVNILGREPDAWGRPADGPYAIDAAEVEFLRSKGKRLWLWGGATSASVVAGNFWSGLRYGVSLASHAAALRYHAGCLVGPDIEASAGWEPTAEWVAGALAQPQVWGYVPCPYYSPRNSYSLKAMQGAQRILADLGKPTSDVWVAGAFESPNPKEVPLLSAAPPCGVDRWAVVGWQWALNVPLPGLPSSEWVDLDVWSDTAPLMVL